MKKAKAMRRNPSRKRRLTSAHLIQWAAYGTVGLVMGGNTMGETLITFEGFSAINIPIDTITGYGDNVNGNNADYTVSPGVAGITGTPDITLDWLGSRWDTYTGWDGRGSVAQSDFNATDRTVSIAFNPSPIFAALLVSFDLDEYAAGGAGDITWSVVGSDRGQLATGNWTMSELGGRSLITPNITGQVGETLTLSLKLNNGAGSYFALDNLTFDQVPEPSTLGIGALGALALGAAAMRRRARA